MPDRAAIITALILDRPLCEECLTSKSGLTPSRIEETLTVVRAALKLTEGHGRCRACGARTTVLSLERPSPQRV
jgi:hypothetical protein